MKLKTFLIVIGFAALGFLCGMKWRERQMRPQIDWAVQTATKESDIARQWEAQYQQVYPLVRQWRSGYEDLAKRCGVAR